ncbi:hypothetical protein [Microbacterium aurantiacum]|uniref:hypothetical protein n=1 Tax=Microbacterium aurantiacum TaxID=162393 RepID=UPI003F495138
MIASTAADPGCEWWDVACNIGDGVSNIISQGANDALQEFVNNILEGYGKAIVSLGTLWVNVPSPVTVTDAGGGAGGGNVPPNAGAFETILSYVTWVSAGIAVMSLIVAGVMMAARRRMGDGEAHMGRVGIILLSVILLSSASALVAGFWPAVTDANNASSVVGFLQNQLWWYAGGLAILSIMVAAARMAWQQRGEPLRELAGSLLTLIAVSGAGLTVIVLATQAADAFSVWILSASTDCDITNGESNCFGTNIFAMISLSASAPIGLIGVFLLGLLALLMSYVQIILMVVRGGMLVVLAGILPVTASFTNTEMGRMWFKRAVGWTIAFILYKPAAAIVYAAAFRMVGVDLFKSDGTGLLQILTGLALMLIALIALPALIRFVAPAAAVVAGGAGGAALAMGAVGVAGAADVATGAVRASSSRSSGGGGGGYNEATGSGGGAAPRPPAPAAAPAGAAAGGGAAASGGGGAAGAGGGAAAGAGGGAAAGAAGGPVGMAVGVGLSKVAEGAKQGAAAARSAAEDATGSN